MIIIVPHFHGDPRLGGGMVEENQTIANRPSQASHLVIFVIILGGVLRRLKRAGDRQHAQSQLADIIEQDAQSFIVWQPCVHIEDTAEEPTDRQKRRGKYLRKCAKQRKWKQNDQSPLHDLNKRQRSDFGQEINNSSDGAHLLPNRKFPLHPRFYKPELKSQEVEWALARADLPARDVRCRWL